MCAQVSVSVVESVVVTVVQCFALMKAVFWEGGMKCTSAVGICETLKKYLKALTSCESCWHFLRETPLKYLKSTAHNIFQVFLKAITETIARVRVLKYHCLNESKTKH